MTRAFVGTDAGQRRDGLRFRPVEDGDRPFLHALYAEVRAREMAPVEWPEARKLAFLAEQCDLQHCHYVKNYKGADFLVIEEAGRPIGRIYVYRSPGEIRLMEVTLVPERRGRGLGEALLREIMDEARATGAKVTLHVEPENPAQRLYARLGFRLIEHRGIYDFLGWDPREAPLS
ncbi:MAG TPA: GNAT family N-acetyltransferase [Rudaea sp.]|nr:GNAT family N-acetyltransferase [Rudaea sp.]